MDPGPRSPTNPPDPAPAGSGQPRPDRWPGLHKNRHQKRAHPGAPEGGMRGEPRPAGRGSPGGSLEPTCAGSPNGGAVKAAPLTRGSHPGSAPTVPGTTLNCLRTPVIRGILRRHVRWVHGEWSSGPPRTAGRNAAGGTIRVASVTRTAREGYRRWRAWRRRAHAEDPSGRHPVA